MLNLSAHDVLKTFTYTPLAMTTLNSRIQLAMLNRKKSKNILQKGFTLVELMIVIVIVGILSAVALPNFLNQTAKAKAVEGTTKISAALKSAGAEWHTGTIVCTDFVPADTDEWTYASTECADDDISYTGVHDDVGTITGTLVPTTGVTTFTTAAPDV